MRVSTRASRTFTRRRSAGKRTIRHECFLQHHKDRKNKKRFDTFLDELIEGAGPKEALGKTTLESLDAELSEYVRQLR